MKVEKKFTFEACHFLRGVEKCCQLHGHTYQLIVGIKGRKNQGTDMVIDFRDIAKPVRELIIDEWDHKFFANKKDAQIRDLLGFSPIYTIKGDGDLSITIPSTSIVLLDGKPTCETMCTKILNILHTHNPNLDWYVKLSEGLDNWTEAE